MGAPEERSAKLDELDRRIRAAREARVPKRGRSGDKFAMANVAWRMTLELVVGVCVGAAMGYGLDWVFGVRPAFLILFILLGFAGGIRTAMKSAQEVARQQAAQAARDEKAASAARDDRAASAAGDDRAAEAAGDDKAAPAAGEDGAGGRPVSGSAARRGNDGD